MLEIRHSFEIGFKLGRTVRGPQDDLTIGELQQYCPEANIDALVQGFEDGKINDRFRLNLGRRLWEQANGITRKA